MLSHSLKKFSIFFILLISLMGMSFGALIDNNDLYYKFDGDLIDSTGNTTATNSGTTDITGKINNARNFDGISNAITLNSVSTLSGDKTISFWIYIDTVTGADYIFDSNDGANRLILGLNPSSTGNYETYDGISWKDSGQSYTTGTWQLITWVFDTTGTRAILYLNGNNVYNATVTNRPLDSSPVLGSTFGIGGSFFDGRIDEFSIWGRALTSSEVTTLYNDNTGLQYPYAILTPQIQVNVTNGSAYNNFPLNISMDTTSNVNMTVYVNDVFNQSFIDTNSSSISLFFLEQYNNLSFKSEDINGVNWNNISIINDYTAPTIDILNISERSQAELNLSEVFNVTDSLSGINLCNINITYLENITNASQYDFFVNCTDTIILNATGSYNAFVFAEDNAGNINTTSINSTFNPFFYVYFEDSNATTITNFTINGTFYENYFFGQIADYGFGNHTFLFSKTSYNDLNFTLTFEAGVDINQTINVDPSTISILVKNVDDGLLTDPANFTILLDNTNTGETQEYQIVNGNSINISNNLALSTELAISIIQNDSIISSVALVNPRQDVTLDLYVTNRVTVNRVFEVLNPSLSVIPNSYVFLYIYIEGFGFVLQSQKQTNGVGKVNFPIIENVKSYNLCNTYNEKEKCLTQVIFVDEFTDPNQIIHDPDLTANTKEILDFISWSYIENKTNTSSEMTYIFDDSQRLVTQFCLNVSRTTDRTTTIDLGAFCVDSYGGNVVQTFSLSQNQYIDYTFQYTFENQTTILNKVRSYYDIVDFTELKSNSVFDLLFIFIYFGTISLLLRYKNFDWYNIGLLIVMIVIFMVQAYINENYINLGVWGFMAINTIALYTVRYGD